jgi:chromosomal replication initiator protein
VVTNDRAKELWRSVLGDLEMQLTRPAFETFLKNSQGTSLRDNELTVTVPTPFAVEWLEHRAYGMVQNAAERAAGRPIDVRFNILQPATRGNGGGSPDAGPATAVAPRPTPAALGLSERYTFNTFVVGPSNRLAFGAAWAVADMPGNAYNPLFIYAGVGLGKTHLLHAIGLACRERGLNVVYVSSEQFTNQFIAAIQERSTEEFRTRYRSADVLLIDDIQFIGGKEQTQEGFFHTFNDLHNASRQIVLTSDRPPRALALLEDRLRSRFEWGLTVDIQPPDLETRLAILRAKAQAIGLAVADDVLEFLARKVQRNVRELEGSLNRLAAFCSFTSVPPTMETAQRALADLIPTPARQAATPEMVLTAVSRQLGISRDSLTGPRRDKKTAIARQIAMYLLREDLNLSFSEIGRLLGNRDHSTVTYAVSKVASDANVDAGLRRAILEIREALTSPHRP